MFSEGQILPDLRQGSKKMCSARVFYFFILKKLEKYYSSNEEIYDSLNVC